jgi:hypothetical protein
MASVKETLVEAMPKLAAVVGIRRRSPGGRRKAAGKSRRMTLRSRSKRRSKARL